jgi:DNA-binding NarL/FixJ family response regulator
MLAGMGTDDTPHVIEKPVIPTAPAVRILIVDADRRVRQSLAGLIDLAPGLEVTGVASDGTSALSMIVEQTPDIALVDPCLPEVGTGLAFMTELSERFPHLTLVAMHCDDAMEGQALATGAQVFVAKSGQPEALVEALRLAARRHGHHQRSDG